MWQTLFVIPRQVAGLDVFGFGWLLAAWALVATVFIVRSWRREGFSAETRSQIGLAAMVGLVIALVLPRLVDPQLEGLAVRGYGAMLLVAVASGLGLTLYRAHRVDLDAETILSLMFWLFVAGIVGARAFYVIEYWPSFQRGSLVATLLAIVNITQGGLVVYGSLLAGGAALVAFIYKHKLPGLALTDLIAPGVVLGVGLGRLGCLMNGCCFGDLSDVPWAVRFPTETPAYRAQAERGLVYVHGLMFEGSAGDPPVIERVEPGSEAEKNGLRAGQTVIAAEGLEVHTVAEAQTALLETYGAGKTVEVAVAGDPRIKRWTIAAPVALSRPVHPTQIYSMVDGVLLCLLLLAYEPFKRRDGELTALVLTLHPISRFLLEEIRVDEPDLFTGLTISQNISVAIFVGGMALWVYLLARRPAEVAWRGRPSLAS